MGSSGNSKVEAYATILSQLFLVFGGVIPYIPQYLDITRSGDASGFSTLVCFLLIVANTLRIVYWFGHYFDEALLMQSIVMLIAMFIILELCIRMERVRAAARGLESTEKHFTDFKLQDFWQWTDLSSYFQAVVLIACISAGTIFMSIDNAVVVEGIGYSSLLMEACLAVPQLIKNSRSRSVQGMNVLMVVLWLIGDSFKGFFYIWKNQPFPFIMNASIMLMMDFLILLQVAMF